MNILAFILIIVGWLLIMACYYSFKRIDWLTKNFLRLNNLVYCHNVIKIAFEDYSLIVYETFFPDYEDCIKELSVNNFEDFIKNKEALRKLNFIEDKLKGKIDEFLSNAEATTLTGDVIGLSTYIKSLFPEGI